MDGQGEDVSCWSVEEGNSWRLESAWSLPESDTAHKNWSVDWTWKMVLTHGDSCMRHQSAISIQLLIEDVLRYVNILLDYL